MRDPIRIDYYQADELVCVNHPHRSCLALVFWAPIKKLETSQPLSFLGADRHEVAAKIQKFIDDGRANDERRRIAHKKMLATKARRENERAKN